MAARLGPAPGVVRQGTAVEGEVDDLRVGREELGGRTQTISSVTHVGISGAAETKSPLDAGSVNVMRARI